MELILNNWNVTALRLYFLFLGYLWCYKILLNWWFSSSRFLCVGVTLLSCYDSDHTLILLIHVWFCDQHRIHLDRVVLLSLVAHLLKRQFFIGELRYPMLLLVFPFTNLFIKLADRDQWCSTARNGVWLCKIKIFNYLCFPFQLWEETWRCCSTSGNNIFQSY